MKVIDLVGDKGDRPLVGQRRLTAGEREEIGLVGDKGD